MLKYIVLRFAASIPTLLAVLTVIFIVIRMVPGDPAIAILGDSATEESIAALRERLGLNQPLIYQYFDFLWGVIQGDIGTSIISNKSVWSEVLVVMPFTLELTFFGILIGVVFGLPLGVIAALNRNNWIDYSTRVVSLLGLSFPAFYTSILLILIFSVQLDWFPVITDTNITTLSDRAYNLVLPALSLGLIMIAYIARATRSTILEVLGEDYIRTAYAKGLPFRTIINRHVLRNAFIPIITVVGLYLGYLIGNSILTEMVFNRPGLGKLIIGALEQRDYAMLQGVMIIFAFFIVIVNLITDLTYGLSDPRVRYQ